jgi:glycosyltransferase involved in cell wall biosynthesis
MGGLEKLLVEFARYADRQRFDLHFLSLSTRGRLANDIEACGWPVTALDEPDGVRPGLVWRLARAFRRLGADVVHTHDDKPLLYGAPAAALAGVPRQIHTRHGQAFFLRPRQARLISLAARLTDGFVCVSEDSARVTVRRHGVAPRGVSTIWNGIDLGRFAYSGPRADGPAVTVARLNPEKDMATLLRAVALVVRSQPAFRLEVAGDGPCLADLKQTAADLRLNGHVRFLGLVSDVPALLIRARLFVLSSVSEGVSLTLLEAMARGLPVAATRVGGNPEVVADGDTGLLVPARSPAALAEALLRLYGDADLGRRLGLAGRRRVEAHFDVRRMVARYEALYRQQRGCPHVPAGAC